MRGHVALDPPSTRVPPTPSPPSPCLSPAPRSPLSTSSVGPAAAGSSPTLHLPSPTTTRLVLQTKVHTKVGNHGEGPY